MYIIALHDLDKLGCHVACVKDTFYSMQVDTEICLEVQLEQLALKLLAVHGVFEIKLAIMHAAASCETSVLTVEKAISRCQIG